MCLCVSCEGELDCYTLEYNFSRAIIGSLQGSDFLLESDAASQSVQNKHWGEALVRSEATALTGCCINNLRQSFLCLETAGADIQ